MTFVAVRTDTVPTHIAHAGLSSILEAYLDLGELGGGRLACDTVGQWKTWECQRINGRSRAHVCVVVGSNPVWYQVGKLARQCTPHNE